MKWRSCKKTGEDDNGGICGAKGALIWGKQGAH